MGDPPPVRKVREARLFLIGFPACGKSTLGRQWAKELCVRFIDTDEWIARATGYGPAEWIRERGEEAFREAELRVVEMLLEEPPPLIAALGGGTVTIPGLSEKLRAVGWVLWVDPPWEWLLERLRHAPRPLLTGRPETEWHQLWHHRRAFYRMADLHWPPHLVPEACLLPWLRHRLNPEPH